MRTGQEIDQLASGALRRPARLLHWASQIFLLAVSVAIASLTWTTPAQAHVKWFAPYIVGAPPQPIGATLTNIWFWTAIVLVLVFFLATRYFERSPAGQGVLDGMDHLTTPFWGRADDFMRVAIGTFFVAIYAVGGVYLTPDLATPNEWVSWFQLLIAAGLFWRKTMPLSALGIILLWALALTDYDLFHLLDYLALGIGVAGYLVLAASDRPHWFRHRFEVLRWGIAIALMWSSLEKFAYPEWFSPLVEEKPFLTFGMPEHVFVPMAGVAEFTMGFGLLWTPLVRRLSAVALIIIFLSAVWPFGRIDMVGHALIMSTIFLVALDPEREVHFVPRVKQALAGVPLGLATAMVVLIAGYWGAHRTIYGPEGDPEAVAAAAQMAAEGMATHSHSPEQPHGPMAAGGIGAPPDRGEVTQLTGPAVEAHADHAMAAQEPATPDAAFETMMATMHDMPGMPTASTGAVNADFLRLMIPHHQGAVDMAQIVMDQTDDPEVRALAEHIIAEQEAEIAEMEAMLERISVEAPISE